MALFGKTPPRCGLCGKSAGCKGHAPKGGRKQTKQKVEQRTVTTAKGSTIVHNVKVATPTGNVHKNGNLWCGKCGSRIVNGVHSGLCG